MKIVIQYKQLQGATLGKLAMASVNFELLARLASVSFPIKIWKIAEFIDVFV